MKYLLNILIFFSIPDSSAIPIQLQAETMITSSA